MTRSSQTKRRKSSRTTAPASAAPPTAPAQHGRLDAKIKFMGDLPAVVGTRSIALSLPSEYTVRELLAHLSATYGEAFTSRVFSHSGKPHHYILIFVDGTKVQFPADFDKTLGRGEVDVVMLPMFGGG